MIKGCSDGPTMGPDACHMRRVIRVERNAELAISSRWVAIGQSSLMSGV
jgi:hypothetical protein